MNEIGSLPRSQIFCYCYNWSFPVSFRIQLMIIACKQSQTVSRDPIHDYGFLTTSKFVQSENHILSCQVEFYYDNNFYINKIMLKRLHNDSPTSIKILSYIESFMEFSEPPHLLHPNIQKSKSNSIHKNPQNLHNYLHYCIAVYYSTFQ